MFRTNGSSSLLLATICIFIFAKSTNASDVLDCNVPRNFTVDISKDRRANIYQPELTVRLDNDSFTIISYPGISSVNIQARNVIVAFKGYLIIEDVSRGIATERELISQIYVDRISGIARRGLQDSTDSTVHDCRIVLLPTETISPSVHPRIANELRRFAESCVEVDTCQRIVRTREQDFVTARSINEAGLLSVYADDADPLAIGAKPWNVTNKGGSTDARLNSTTVQSFINKLVDIALNVVIEKLRVKHEGNLPVPNIDKYFSTGSSIFKTNGHFEAIDGTFRDLTTIRRTSNASLSHDGYKFLASCAFGLDTPEFSYEHYRLKYGVIKTYGILKGKINGVELETEVSVDYDQTPCVMKVQHLKVSKLGKLNISMTGLGSLNWFASKLVSWITEQWHDTIIHNLEDKMRKVVQSRLATFNCERFRP